MEDADDDQLLSLDFLYPTLIPICNIAPSIQPIVLTNPCDECERPEAILYCADCQEIYCYRCSDAVHLVKQYATHYIRYLNPFSDLQNHITESIKINDVYPVDSRMNPFNHIYAKTLIPSRTIDAPKRNENTIQATESVGKFQLGQNVVFRFPEHPTRECFGTIVSAGMRTSEGNAFYYRILYARGVQLLPSLFYQANLTLPDAWPIEIRQYVNQWHAIRAVELAEEVALKFWRRERYGKRTRDLFRKCLNEVMEAIDEKVEEMDFDQMDLLAFHQKGQCLTMPAPLDLTHPDANTPWPPHHRIRYVLLPQPEIETVEEARPRKMKKIILDMLYMYLGSTMDRWRRFARHDKASRTLQRWIRQRFFPPKVDVHLDLRDVHEKIRRESVVKQELRVARAKDVLYQVERCLRRVFEGLYWRRWKSQVEFYQMTQKPWHPSLGIQSLPKLFQFEFTSTGEVMIAQDLKKWKQFKSKHTGPTERSFWIVPQLILMGQVPQGQAFEKKRPSSRSDTIASILLQGISTFVSLLSESQSSAIQDRQDTLRLELEQARKATEKSIRKLEMELLAENVDEMTRPKLALAQESLVRADETLACLKPLNFIDFPIPRDGVRSMDETLALLEQLEIQLRAGERVYIYSQHGHGRVGLVAASLLGRLYGLSATEALRYTQICHDSMKSVENFKFRVSSPQSMAQIQMMQAILSHSVDPIYQPINTMTIDPYLRYQRQHERGKVMAAAAPSPLTKDEMYKKWNYNAKREARSLMNPLLQ